MPDLADLFPGYASEWLNTSAGRIFARVGGKGPPLLLLHTAAILSLYESLNNHKCHE